MNNTTDSTGVAAAEAFVQETFGLYVYSPRIPDILILTLCGNSTVENWVTAGTISGFNDLTRLEKLTENH